MLHLLAEAVADVEGDLVGLLALAEDADPTAVEKVGHLDAAVGADDVGARAKGRFHRRAQVPQAVTADP